jgi:hypothetical protein
MCGSMEGLRAILNLRSFDSHNVVHKHFYFAQAQNNTSHPLANWKSCHLQPTLRPPPLRHRSTTSRM